MNLHPRRWTSLDQTGCYVEPGRFYIDPGRSAPLAVVTHGHSDHARRGHGTVIATPQTHAIMEARLGRNYCGNAIRLELGESLEQNGVRLTFHPAGHILGSVQVRIEHRESVLGVSGDYKCGGGDPTCEDFDPVPCDVFLTEATFASPFYRFPHPREELRKLLHSLEAFPDALHWIEAYSLGKSQRIIRMLREAGFEEPIGVHSSVAAINQVYQAHGIELGLCSLMAFEKELFDEKPRVVVTPTRPGAEVDADAVIRVGASGWYSARSVARQAGVDLPMVISDHCDWPELLNAIEATGASEIWVTHGTSASLKHEFHDRNVAVLGLQEALNPNDGRARWTST